MKMKRFLPLLLLPLLISCGTAQINATTTLAIACDSYATALDQLTPRKATMSASTIATIDKANAVAGPACAPGSPIDPAALVATVQGAIAVINGAK